MTNNSLAYDVYSRGQELADNLVDMGVSDADVDDGLKTLVGKVLDIPNKQPSTLTIDVPLNLEYGDDFNITGVLTSCTSVGIADASIKLKVGDTVVDTDTTDENGEVSFTQCPVATGNHSFQLVFEGNITYTGSESSVVTREVSKETSVVTLNYPAASSNHYSDEAIVVSGVLTDNDNTPIAGKSVVVKDGDTVLKTLTSDSDGSFSDTITIASTGSHTVNVSFAGDDYYTSSSVSRSITIVAPSLSLTSNKSILSAEDSESALITATLNSATPTGQTVTMGVYKQSDDTLVESLTVTDVGDGTYTASYLGKDAGTLNIKCICGSLEDTVNIEDLWLYNPLTSNDNLFSCVNSKCNCSYSSNGLYGNHTGSGVDFYILNSVPSGNHSVEFEISALGYGDADYCDSIIFNGVYLLQNNSNGYQIRRLDESAQSWNTPKLAVGDKVKAEISNGTVSIYVNGTLKGSKSSYNSQTGLYLNAPTRSITVKNLKIHQL